MKKISGSYYIAHDDLPIVAANKLGFFREEGIEIEQILIRPSRDSVRALLGGVFQFATGLGNRVSAIINEGADLRVVCVTMDGGQDPFVSSPDFNSLRELFEHHEQTGEKAKVGINGYNCTDHLILTRRLADAGFGKNEIQKSIEFVEVAGSQNRLKEFEKNPRGLDAHLLHTHYHYVSEMMGFKKLLIHDQYEAPFLRTPRKGLVVTSDYLKKNAREVEIMIRTILRGVNWILSTPAHEVKEKMIEWFEYDKVIDETKNIHRTFHGCSLETPITPEFIADQAYSFLKEHLVPSGCVPWDKMELLSELHTIEGKKVPSPKLFTDFCIVEKVRAHAQA